MREGGSVEEEGFFSENLRNLLNVLSDIRVINSLSWLGLLGGLRVPDSRVVARGALI